MYSTKYQHAKRRIGNAYHAKGSPYYHNKTRYHIELKKLDKQFREDPESVECKFCSFKGNKSELLTNGHCPKCQSPSTKNNNGKENNNN